MDPDSNYHYSLCQSAIKGDVESSTDMPTLAVALNLKAYSSIRRVLIQWQDKYVQT